MKLLELLVKERIEWPADGEVVVQDKYDNIAKFAKEDWDISVGKFGHSGGEWQGNFRCSCAHDITLSELADDWQTAIVTKEQYDNACKLVDDGYTLWFGGECPVDGDTHVQVMLANGKLSEGKAAYIADWAKALVEGKESEYNIIAYRISTGFKTGGYTHDLPIGVMTQLSPPGIISTHKHDAPLDAFRALGWTDEQLIEHGYAKIAEPGDEELSVAYKPVDLLSLHVPDVVNHPSHYTNGKVECIDAIESATVGKTGIEAVCVANVIKYLWRYEDKNGLEDIKKAQWYLNKLIEVMK